MIYRLPEIDLASITDALRALTDDDLNIRHVAVGYSYDARTLSREIQVGRGNRSSWSLYPLPAIEFE